MHTKFIEPSLSAYEIAIEISSIKCRSTRGNTLRYHPTFVTKAAEIWGEGKTPQEYLHLCTNEDAKNEYICVHGNHRKFDHKKKKYNSCRMNCQCKIDMCNNTMLERYGKKSFAGDKNVKDKAKKTMIEKYGHDNASKVPELKKKIKESISKVDKELVSNKRKKTYIERYGSDHPMKNTDIKDKVKQTCIEKYGVEYSSQDPTIKEKIKNSLIQKYKDDGEELLKNYTKTCLERYGVENAAQSDIIKERVKIINKEKYNRNYFAQLSISEDSYEILKDKNLLSEYVNLNGTIGSIEKLKIGQNTLYRYLRFHDIPYDTKNSKYEYELREILDDQSIPYISSDRKILYPKEIDIYIPHKNLAIEINGLYWHSEIHGAKDRNYHYEKWKKCNDQNITLLTITDDEWLDRQDFWVNKILHMCGNNIAKLGARKCTVKFVEDRATVMNFLNENHLQGSINFSYAIGLFHKNILNAVMCFGNTRSNTVDTLELTRFCSKKNLHISGGASKMLKFFIEQKLCSNIISFSDNRTSNGDLYIKLGFSLERDIPPDYYYLSPDYKTKFHKSNFKKSLIAKKFSLTEDYIKSNTEWELMQEMGYDRFWDCGKKKWALKI
jgi:hypothetical protein